MSYIVLRTPRHSNVNIIMDKMNTIHEALAFVESFGGIIVKTVPITAQLVDSLEVESIPIKSPPSSSHTCNQKIVKF